MESCPQSVRDAVRGAGAHVKSYTLNLTTPATVVHGCAIAHAAEALPRRRPGQAPARVVTSGYQSAQPPADRSVQRLIRRRRCTAPADRCGARPRSAPRRRGNALERTLRLASPRRPPRGSRRKAPAPLRCARAAGSCHPPSPLSGGSADRVRSCRFSGCAAPAYA